MLQRLAKYLPAIPYPHHMAFAPLDAWARMLLPPRRRGWVPPRYWPRLVLGLGTSAVGTVLTLPERLILAPILWAARRRGRDEAGAPVLRHKPGVVIVLGYYRSGTTHLHYLLSCDRRFITPRWAWTLAPAGFALSWGLLRWFLVPFLSNSRPQDDVAFGPEWPAEDDFALNNWAAVSSLPGRLSMHDERAYRHFCRYNDLRRLTAGELARWRNIQWAFSWKLAWLAGRRAILLKTPAHTARVRELVRLYGPDTKFVHIARDPAAVVRSNVAMHFHLGPYWLQDSPGAAAARARIIEEYDATERLFLEAAAGLPPGRLARMRYQDLVADPMAELRRVYAELGLEWTGDYELRVGEYLRSVRDYRAAAEKVRNAEGAEASRRAQRDELPEELAWMVGAFGHDRAARERAELPGMRDAAARRWSLPPAIGGAIAAMTCGLVWIGEAWLMRNRLDWLAWPTGAAIGIAMMRCAGRRGETGSLRLGLWAGMLTLLVWAAFALPISLLAQPPGAPLAYYQRDPIPWVHVWYSARDGAIAVNNAFWMFLGVMTALRFASRKHVRAPGY